jgi:pimeloyl-ACP methyl ester carboxylesterase
MTSSVVSIGSGDHHVLAVHGWFGSARGWGSLPDYLDRSAYTYAFMDLRGYGERKHVPGEFTMEEAATDAVALADELGWETFSVVGHSMGGKIAHQILLLSPERVRKLAKSQADGQTPVKVIVGVNDPALSADVMEQTWLVFFPEGEMTILPDAGHYPMFESPVSLATSIEEFLGRE